MVGGMGLMKNWWVGFEVCEAPESQLSERTISRVKWILQVSLGLLLIGHGGFGAFVHQEYLITHWRAIGIPATHTFIAAVGWFEILLGVIVAARPMIPVVWFILAWKIATELLYPIAGDPVDIFETIERWGDYGGCVALLLILYYYRNRSRGA